MTAAAAQTLGPLPEWNLADLYASPDAPEFARDMKKGEELSKAFAEKYRGKLASLDGAALAQALKDYEADLGPSGPHRLLCAALLRGRHDRFAARQVLWRRLREADRDLDAAAVLRARAEPHRGCGAREGDEGSGARPLPPVDREPADGEALPARRQAGGTVPRKVADLRRRLQPPVRRDHGGRCASMWTARS